MPISIESNCIMCCKIQHKILATKESKEQKNVCLPIRVSIYILQNGPCLYPKLLSPLPEPQNQRFQRFPHPQIPTSFPRLVDADPPPLPRFHLRPVLDDLRHIQRKHNAFIKRAVSLALVLPRSKNLLHFPQYCKKQSVTHFTIKSNPRNQETKFSNLIYKNYPKLQSDSQKLS